MNKKTVAICLLPALLGACASVPPPTPLPYHFSLSELADARPTPEDGGTDPLYDVVPFDSTAVGLSFMSHLPYSVYGSREASLHLRVTHYEATSDKNRYAVSIAMEGYADDDSPRPRKVGQFNASCSEVQHEGFALDAFATEVSEQKSLAPLTTAGRDKRMFAKVLNDCTAELARQFSAAVVSKGE